MELVAGITWDQFLLWLKYIQNPCMETYLFIH